MPPISFFSNLCAMSRRGCKFDLHPTPAQAEGLRALVGVTRLVFNLALEQRRDHWRNFRRVTGRHLGYARQAAELTSLRAEFDFIRAQSQTAQQQALRDLDRAFQRFFAGTAGYPRPRVRGINDVARIQARECPARKLNAKWAEVRVPKLGWVRLRLTRPLLGRVTSVTFSHRAVGGWSASFACEMESPAPLPSCRPMVGIDRGIVHTLALSDGTFSDLPVERLRLLDRRGRRLERIAARGRRGSGRNQRAKLRVAACAAKAARVRRHWIHVTTRRLAEAHFVVVLEDLRVRNMTASAAGTTADPGMRVRLRIPT